MAHVYIWHLVYILLFTTSPLYSCHMSVIPLPASDSTQEASDLLDQFIGQPPISKLRPDYLPVSKKNLPLQWELVRVRNNYALIYARNSENCSVITRCGDDTQIEKCPFNEISRFKPRLKLKNTIPLENLLSEKHLNE